MASSKKPAPGGDSASKARPPDLEPLPKLTDMQDVPSPARDQELIDRKQRQIVEGACQVMFKKGFHGTSIRDVAAACNMSMGQLYHYIASKDDILYLVHRHMQEVWFGHLSEAGLDQGGEPMQRLEKTLRLTLDFIHRNKELILFIYTETKYLEREHLRQVLEIDDRNIVGFYRNLLAQLPHIGLDARSADTAANLIAFMMVFLSLRGWNLKESELQENIDFIAGFVMRGLGLKG
ncbi:MAG: TetR/AcrR family transcriptional regulator [Pseudomonadota bacterium]